MRESCGLNPPQFYLCKTNAGAYGDEKTGYKRIAATDEYGFVIANAVKQPRIQIASATPRNDTLWIIRLNPIFIR